MGFDRKTVIVLGLTPQGLSVIRTLARGGCNVYAFGTSKKNVGYYSRYGIKKIFHSVEELKSLMQGLLENFSDKPLCYITSGEILASVLAEYPELYKMCDVISGDYETVSMLAHKDKMYDWAVGRGLDVAEYVTLDRFLPTGEFPVFLKRNYEIPLFFKALKINSLQDFNAVVDKIPKELMKDVMVQTYIDIPRENLMEISAQFFFSQGIAQGGLVAHQKHKLRKGLTSYLVELDDSQLVARISELSAHFMDGLNYTGFAEFEYMYDTRNARLFFLEVNTRTCGTQSALSFKFENLDAVMLNPYSPPELISRKKKIRWMNIQRDIRARIEACDFSDLFAVFKSSFDIFDLRDMKPFIRQII